MELKPGGKLEPYEIVSAIGRGGMGALCYYRKPFLRAIGALVQRVKTQFFEGFLILVPGGSAGGHDGFSGALFPKGLRIPPRTDRLPQALVRRFRG
jgi:hypothetical protein